MNRTWCLLLSDTGLITLSVSEGCDVSGGYRHHAPEQLTNDLAALIRGEDPRSWDCNALITMDQITNRGRELPSGKLKPEERLHNLVRLNIKSKVICTQNSPLPGNMGVVGKRLFDVQVSDG